MRVTLIQLLDIKIGLIYPMRYPFSKIKLSFMYKSSWPNVAKTDKECPHLESPFHWLMTSSHIISTNYAIELRSSN